MLDEKLYIDRFLPNNYFFGDCKRLKLYWANFDRYFKSKTDSLQARILSPALTERIRRDPEDSVKQQRKQREAMDGVWHGIY